MTETAVPLPEGMVMPMTKVTLKVPAEENEDGSRWIVVAEDPETVVNMSRSARNGGLIKLTRVKGMKPSPFWTRGDNVTNVELWS